jgi:hypothetical protein
VLGRKEDTEENWEDSSSSPPELTVDSLGHCQSVGNWMFNSTRSQKLQSIATMWILRQVPISQAAKSCLPAVWW